MRKKIIQFAAILLLLALYVPAPARAEGEQTAPLLRIGLYYGSDALAGANLDNSVDSVGSGYRFGYFDSALQFWQVGYTYETKISVVKTQNVWFNGSNYVDTPSGGAAVGCYHIQLPTVYPTYEDARAAADTVGGNGFPAWIGGSYYVRAGAYTTKEEAAAALAGWGVEGAVVGTSAYGVSVVKTGESLPLFQFDGGADFALAIKPGLDESEKTVTWFKGYRYYGAFRYERRDGGNLTVVNIVPLEDYVKGSVPHEMSPSWPIEALKAQAVCARTYAVIHQGKHEKDGFDLCPTTDCQMYLGLNRSSESTDRAVDETAGKYAWYDGALAETYYFSCDGGATESAKNVWGKDYPYLTGVMDPYEPAVADKTGKYNWSVTFTKTELRDILRGKGYLCADIVNFYVAETTPTGNVYKITFVDADGKSWSFLNPTRGKEYCRTLLGLNSIRYTVSGNGGSYFVNDKGDTLPSVVGSYAVDGTGTAAPIEGAPYVATGTGTEPLVNTAAGDSFTITGSGWGHNVGMSQWGAYAMAEQGKTYEEILQFYFTGIDVR